MKALLKDVEQLKIEKCKLINENKKLISSLSEQEKHVKTIESENAEVKDAIKNKNNEIGRLNQELKDAELL